MPDLYYCIAAYNEEKCIASCLASLARQDIRRNVNTIICLNGCTDNTEEIVLRAKKSFPRLKIRVIHSKRGKVFAQNAIIRAVGQRNVPVVFVDADVVLKKDAVRLLYEEIKRLPQLKVVGGWPVPSPPKTLTAWESVLYKILHLRALNPESEIAKHDVLPYKSYALKFPQPSVSKEFECRSKIYFHGRIFMLKNADVFDMPEDKNLADDSFLPNMIHTKYGPGVIRTRFDAIGYYAPYLSLKQHFKTYRRLHLQLHYLDKNYREFKQVRKMEKSCMNWGFILSKGLLFSALMYTLLRKCEDTCYTLLPYKDPADLWQYHAK